MEDCNIMNIYCMYKFEVLFWNISVLWRCILLFIYISETFITVCAPLCSSYLYQPERNFSYPFLKNGSFSVSDKLKSQAPLNSFVSKINNPLKKKKNSQGDGKMTF